jgi:hypothetical protein
MHALPCQSPVIDAFLFTTSNYAVLNFQDDQRYTMLKVIPDVEEDRYIAVQAMTSPLSPFKLLL